MDLAKLNFFSLNVGTSNLLAGLPSLVSSENLDVIFLQEIRLNSAQIENLLPGFRAESNIDSDNPQRPGTAIAWRISNVNLENVTCVTLCSLQIASLGQYRLVKFWNIPFSWNIPEYSNFNLGHA